jgi:hypothetical protein
MWQPGKKKKFRVTRQSDKERELALVTLFVGKKAAFAIRATIGGLRRFNNCVTKKRHLEEVRSNKELRATPGKRFALTRSTSWL